MRFLIFFFFTISTMTVLARGGGMDSGGADNKDILSGSAWFLGDNHVRYCIQIAADFGITQDQARQDIDDAIQTWRDYIAKKEIFIGNAVKDGLFPTTSYKFVAKCDDSEDLAFYLGVSNQKTDDQMKFYENPTAFAHRENFDVDKGWGKGWIWISPPGKVYPGAQFPDWKRPARLRGMLLHELGHVLGNGHVEGTIMEESLTHWMQFSPEMDERAVAVLTHIDDIKEMYICEDCPFEFQGDFANVYDGTELNQLFNLFVGRLPRGNIKSSFKRFQNTAGYFEFHLMLEDDLSMSDFPVNLMGPGSSFDLAENLFSVIRRESPTQVGGNSRTQAGRSLLAQVMINGTSKMLMINRNSSDSPSPLVIFLVDGSKLKKLFSAKLRGM